MADCSEAINALVEAVEAIEFELGVTPSSVYQNVRARLDILESRINNPFAPSPDVENPFLIGNTGVSIRVGDGYPGPADAAGSLYLRTDGYGGLGGLFTRGADNAWWQINAGSGGGGGGGAPSGPAGGDLSGTYPNPTVGTNVITLSKIQTIATDSLLGRDTAGTGNVETISLNSTLIMNGSQVLGRAAISGDVTIAAGANTAIVTDLTISSEVQGSTIYFNGSNWAQLSPSTDGYFLTTHSAGQNPTWTKVTANAVFNSPTIGHSPFYDGSVWKLLGLLTGSNLTDADQTLTVSNGVQYILPTTTSLTSARVKTLSLTGISAGLMVTIYRLNTSANTMAINDASATTLFTFPASATNPIVASFRVNDTATAWTLAGWAPLGPVVNA